MAAPGHTPGHAAFAVASGKDKLFVQSDVTNTPILFVPHPDWQVQYDMDGPKAAETRRKVYDMLAAERMQLTGYHTSLPGDRLHRRGRLRLSLRPGDEESGDLTRQWICVQEAAINRGFLHDSDAAMTEPCPTASPPTQQPACRTRNCW